MLLGKHIKMARILVNMSQTELGKLVGISDDSIGRMELSQGIARGKVSNLNKIKQIFEKKGIEFIYGTGEDSIEGAGIKYFPSKANK